VLMAGQAANIQRGEIRSCLLLGCLKSAAHTWRGSTTGFWAVIPLPELIYSRLMKGTIVMNYMRMRGQAEVLWPPTLRCMTSLPADPGSG
jgi:hypothetical protein